MNTQYELGKKIIVDLHGEDVQGTVKSQIDSDNLIKVRLDVGTPYGQDFIFHESQVVRYPA